MKPLLPSGRLRRAFEMAKVGARTGTALVTSKGSELAAERAAEVLGNLRGLAAKVGQTLSYVDGILPEEQSEAFEKALKKLQRSTFSSSPDAIRARVESELGAPLSTLFLEFEEAPIASASIGQVHRALLHDGRRVAVKVQHPGIEDAVKNDLKNVSLLEGMIGIVGPKGLEAGPVFDEVIRRFHEELDYQHEARAQMAFRDAFVSDPFIVVPEVIASHSTTRVLCSSWETGATLEEVAATAPEELRRSYAETLWRFVFRGNLVGGTFNADPHPGNYLFQPDGRVVFLDFGCIQPIPEPARRAALLVHDAAARGDEAAFQKSVAALLGTRGGAYGDATDRYTRRCFEPLFSRPFHLTRAYAADLVNAGRDLKKHMYAKDGSFVSPPPHLAMMNRLQFGFYSVLARLDVAVDYAALEPPWIEEGTRLERGLIAKQLD